jgi:hypothetical protein
MQQVFLDQSFKIDNPPQNFHASIIQFSNLRFY